MRSARCARASARPRPRRRSTAPPERRRARRALGGDLVAERAHRRAGRPEEADARAASTRSTNAGSSATKPQPGHTASAPARRERLEQRVVIEVGARPRRAAASSATRRVGVAHERRVAIDVGVERDRRAARSPRSARSALTARMQRIAASPRLTIARRWIGWRDRSSRCLPPSSTHAKATKRPWCESERSARAVCAVAQQRRGGCARRTRARPVAHAATPSDAGDRPGRASARAGRPERSRRGGERRREPPSAASVPSRSRRQAMSVHQRPTRPRCAAGSGSAPWRTVPRSAREHDDEAARREDRRRASSVVRPCRHSPWRPSEPSAGARPVARLAAMTRALAGREHARVEARVAARPASVSGSREVDHVIAEHRSHCSSSAASVPTICRATSTRAAQAARRSRRLERGASRHRKRVAARRQVGERRPVARRADRRTGRGSRAARVTSRPTP